MRKRRMNGYDYIIVVNYEAIQKRMAECSYTDVKLSKAVGKSDTWFRVSKKAQSRQPKETLEKIAMCLDGEKDFSRYVITDDVQDQKPEAASATVTEAGKKEEPAMETSKEQRCDPRTEYHIDFAKLENEMAKKGYEYKTLAEEIGQEEDYFVRVKENEGQVRGAFLNYICLILDTNYQDLLYVEPEKDEDPAVQTEGTDTENEIKKAVTEIENIRKYMAKDIGLIKAKVTTQEADIKRIKSKIDKTFKALSEINEKLTAILENVNATKAEPVQKAKKKTS